MRCEKLKIARFKVKPSKQAKIYSKKKHREEILFACGYEAGSTDYGLCRGLQKAGYGCVVMALMSMSNPDGKKRVKTDRIDAGGF